MINPQDRQVLRELARQVRQIAEEPIMQERRRLWIRQNALQNTQPLVLCYPEGCWREIQADWKFQCQDKILRGWESSLRSTIYTCQHVRDDYPIEPWFNLGWRVSSSDFGVEIPKIQGENRGSYVWDPPIKDLDADFHKLHFRQLTVDRAETRRRMEMAYEVMGDILPPRLRGHMCWTMGMTQTVAYLIGMENLLLAMYDNPKGLHRLMAFMRDEHLQFMQWWEQQGLLNPDNENDYVGSGTVGYTDQLPQKDHQPGQPIRLIDNWGFAESQETVGVGPDFFKEFVLQYQVPLLEKFGLNYYGCCEQLEHRIDVILAHVPRLRRVSVAPQANQEILARKLAGRAVFCRKVDPVKVCVEFDEQGIRQELRRTLEIAGGQTMELVLKDTHTVQHEPWRLDRWVQIAREEIDRYMGG